MKSWAITFLCLLFTLNWEASAVTKALPSKKIYLIADINLRGVEWSALGLMDKNSFISSLRGVWLKWLSDNLPAGYDQALWCDEPCLAYHKGWLERSSIDLPGIIDEYSSSRWLVLVFDVRNLSHSLTFNEWKFEWDGRIIFQEIKSKRIIGSSDIQKESHRWRNLAQKEVNSALASRIYRSAINSLPEVLRKDQIPAQPDKVSAVTIHGLKKINDLFTLMTNLNQAGQKLSLESQLDYFSRKQATLLCVYQGEEKMFTDLLSQIKELKSSVRYKLVHTMDGKGHSLKLGTK